MTGWKSKYEIEFKGLREGLHEFEFETDSKFFEHFENSQVQSGSVMAIVTLEKRSTFLKIRFNLKGWVELPCDRCLADYRQNIESEAEMLVKFSETEMEDDVDVMWVKPDEHKINLAQLIYEYIILAIPLRRVHPVNKKGESECDSEMLNRISNVQAETDEQEEITDPRWDALKKLKNNN